MVLPAVLERLLTAPGPSGYESAPAAVFAQAGRAFREDVSIDVVGSALVRSLDFYDRVGYREVGRVTLEDGSILVMLNLPGDGVVVTLELVYDPRVAPVDVGTGFSHLVVQVDRLDATLADLAGENGPKTCFVRDPDGYRIELVEWPPGHSDGITSADFR